MRRSIFLLLLVMVLFTAIPADACQMCMGSTAESKTVAGVQAGILVLLIVTYTLLGWIFFLIVLCVRRMRRHEKKFLAEQAAELRAGGGPPVSAE